MTSGLFGDEKLFGRWCGPALEYAGARFLSSRSLSAALAPALLGKGPLKNKLYELQK